MRKIIYGLSAAVLLASITSAHAMCQCECVNGQNRPMCTSAMEMPPMCPPMQCPIMAPSITPINPPTLPPLGTRSCRQAQVYNPYSHQYEWQQVCQ